MCCCLSENVNVTLSLCMSLHPSVRPTLTYRVQIDAKEEHSSHLRGDLPTYGVHPLCMCPNIEFQTFSPHLEMDWGGWGCEVSCGGHHRQRGKTTTGSPLDGAVLDFTQILAYQYMSRSQLYLGFCHFG